MRRKRLLLLAVLALAVPVPAFALGTGSVSAAGSLDAQASLDSCGLFENQIVCKIDASYNDVAGATSYTASVSAPNGAVSDYGTVGAGGTSFWVPYVGNGTYTVEIQAWGTPPSNDKNPPLVAEDRVGAGSKDTGDHTPADESDTGPTGGTGATISGSTAGIAGLEAQGEVPQPTECTDPTETTGCCVPAG